MVGSFSLSTPSNDVKNNNNTRIRTTVTEGCFVFQIIQSTKIKVETLRSLEKIPLISKERSYDSEDDDNEIMEIKFQQNDLVNVDMIVTKYTKFRSRSTLKINNNDRSAQKYNLDKTFSDKEEEIVFSDNDTYATIDELNDDDDDDQMDECNSSTDETVETNHSYEDYDATDVEDNCSVNIGIFADRKLHIKDSPKNSSDYMERRKRSLSVTEAYARLSDKTGWILISDKNVDYCRQVTVESGIYCFYVDNVPHGITTRYHPMDDSTKLLPVEKVDRKELLTLQPMIKIYCDSKVTHPETGVNFYRLQVKNSFYFPRWVHDKQCSSKPSNNPDTYKLLPANKVTETTNKRQQFAYQILHGTVVRSCPDCTEESKLVKLGYVLQKGEIVVGNLLRESPCPENGNGPFVRLTSTTTSEKNRLWLFENKLHQMILKPLPVLYGYWEFQVVPSIFNIESQPVDDDRINFGTGIFVYKQPLDRCMSTNETTVAFLKIGDYFQCDCKIAQESLDDNKNTTEYEQMTGKKLITYYYRVILSDGSFGWVSDNAISGGNSNKPAKLQLLTSYESDTVDGSLPDDDSGSWTTEFVRGVAAAACDASIKEIVYQPVGNVLVFQTADFIQINVYCYTKTVQTAFEHSVDSETDEISIHDDESKGNLMAMNNLAMIYNCHRNCKTTKALFEIMRISVVEMMMTSLHMSNNIETEDVKMNVGQNLSEMLGCYDEEKKDDSCHPSPLNSNIQEYEEFGEICRTKRSPSSDVSMIASKRRRLYDEFEIRVRQELLICDHQILSAQAKRNELWNSLQAFDEQRIFGKCITKKRAKALEQKISSSHSKSYASVLLINCKISSSNSDVKPIVQPYICCPTPKDIPDNHDVDVNEFDVDDDHITVGIVMDEGFEVVQNNITVFAKEQKTDEDSLVEDPTVSIDSQLSNEDEILSIATGSHYFDFPPSAGDGEVPSFRALEFVCEAESMKPSAEIEGNLTNIVDNATVPYSDEQAQILNKNKIQSSTFLPSSDEQAQILNIINETQCFAFNDEDAIVNEADVIGSTASTLESVKQEVENVKSDVEELVTSPDMLESTVAVEKVNKEKELSTIQIDVDRIREVETPRLQCTTISSDHANSSDHQVISQCNSSNSTIITGLKTPKRKATYSLPSTKSPLAKANGFPLSSSSGMRRRGLVCGVCFKMFSGKYSRDLHCREAHKLFCRHCDKIFPSFEELKSHRC